MNEMRRIIGIVEGRVAAPVLYHGMSERTLAAMLSQGLRAPSFWGTEELAGYYAYEAALEDGTAPVILRVPLKRFDQAMLAPDEHSLDTPLLSVLDYDENEIADQWSASAQTWRDSLRIVGAVIYNKPIVITAADVTRPDPDDLEY